MKKLLSLFLAAGMLLTILSACAASPEPPGAEPDDVTLQDTPATGGLSPFSLLKVWGPYPYTMAGAGLANIVDPEATERVEVEPVVRCDVQWAEGLSADEALECCIRDYITLALTLRAAPDGRVEQPDCCTEEALRRLYFEAFMRSGALYWQQDATITLESLSYPAADTACVFVGMDVREDSSDICGAVWRESNTVSSGRKLTLVKTADGWQVMEDSSSFAPGSFWSEGMADIQPDILPEKSVQQAVEAYLTMRADEAAGRLGDSGCTTSALLADAKSFAADLGLARVYDAQSRAALYGTVQDTAPDFIRLSVTEVMRIDALSFYGQENLHYVRSAYAVVEHVLTLCPTEDHYIVTGDLYKFGTHQCSIVDYLD